MFVGAEQRRFSPNFHQRNKMKWNVMKWRVFCFCLNEIFFSLAVLDVNIKSQSTSLQLNNIILLERKQNAKLSLKLIICQVIFSIVFSRYVIVIFSLKFAILSFVIFLTLDEVYEAERRNYPAEIVRVMAYA